MLSEKELNFKNIELVLYHNETNVEEYVPWLNNLMQSFGEFLETEHKITKTISFSLNICDESKIKEINSEHRQKDTVTDVLSFPMQDDLRSGEYDTFLPMIELGDLFVCKEVCEKQAEEFNISYFEEFVHLSTHGLLHLCGYDHEISDDEEKMMESLEEKILLRLKDLRKGSE